jgi:hypothetical protein
MEMRAMMAGAAMLTKRIRIINTLYILPMHNAVWAAKEIATLDVLSEGRVDVVVGTGGRPNDYKPRSAPISRRATSACPARCRRCAKPGRASRLSRVPRSSAPSPIRRAGRACWAGSPGPRQSQFRRLGRRALCFSIPGQASEIKEKMDWFQEGWERPAAPASPIRSAASGTRWPITPRQGLHHYVYEYLRIAGHDFAMSVADTMTQHDPGLILETMRAMKETGIDLLFMVPASADVTEVTRLGELVAKI